jgi:hypothetical protein
MKVLMIGDVVARPGRLAVLERIQDLREQHGIDLAVMNAENVAGGFSITPSLADQLFDAGIDVMTSGNHIFDKREVIPYIERQPRLLRPANYPPGTPGSGMWTGEVRGTPVAVLNLIGRVFMQPADDPFRIADALVGEERDCVASGRARLGGRRDSHACADGGRATSAWGHSLPDGHRHDGKLRGRHRHEARGCHRALHHSRTPSRRARLGRGSHLRRRH